MIKYTGLDEMIASLVKIEHNADIAAHEIGRIIEETFTETQGAVPVLTGNLKASGKREILVTRNGVVATIRYGGPGKDRIVKYAGEVNARRDFMAATRKVPERIRGAIEKIM